MIGCLCLHGFTGDPWEIEPVTKYFSKKKNWLVYTPILPGHGPDETLKDVSTFQDWILIVEIAMEELLKRCDKVYVIGHSMGGMLACYIAAKYPAAKLVLLSTAVYYVSPLQQLNELKKVTILRLSRQLKRNAYYQRYQQKIFETPLFAVYQFMQTIKRTRPYIRKVKSPTLIIQGEQDAIVPRRGALYLFKNIGSRHKEIQFLKESSHLICHSSEKEFLIEKIERFLEEE